MKLDEFGIIQKFFRRAHQLRSDVVVGSGDDCAVLRSPPSKQLVMTIDSLMVDRHFPRETSAVDIGYKAVAVSLSDVAAMGGEPAWLLATLSIESIDEKWLTDFANGVFEICDTFGVSLVGGDLTRGPLSVTTQLTGFVHEGAALCRDGARVGDKIYVTGTLGCAGLALADIQNRIKIPEDVQAKVYPRLHRPTPRVQAGLVLSRLASSCIDISDGLAQDVGHLIKRAQVGARIDVDRLPLSHPLAKEFALNSGDDYELCFTISPAREVELLARREELGVPITCIGEIVAQAGTDFYTKDGQEFKVTTHGYQHF